MFIFSSCGSESTPVYNLTTTPTPDEAGSVSPSSDEYDEGESVEITATPNADWVFDSWEGDASGNDNPTTVKMDADKDIAATFVVREYPLTVEIEGEGIVKEEVVQEKTTDYPAGTTVELTANAVEGWKFVEWQGELQGNENPQQITVDGEKSITAVFERQNFELTIEIEGEGEVEEEIIQSKTTDYPFETNVELTANPSEGWVFSHWEGDASGSDNPLIIDVTDEKEVVAIFEIDVVFRVIGLSDGMKIEDEIHLNFSSNYTSMLEKIEVIIDDSTYVIDSINESISIESWNFENGQRTVEINAHFPNNIEFQNEYSLQFENYFFQWDTDYYIDNNTRQNNIEKLVLYISDIDGKTILSKDILYESDGLLQLLPPSEVDTKIDNFTLSLIRTTRNLDGSSYMLSRSITDLRPWIKYGSRYTNLSTSNFGIDPISNLHEDSLFSEPNTSGKVVESTNSISSEDRLVVQVDNVPSTGGELFYNSIIGVQGSGGVSKNDSDSTYTYESWFSGGQPIPDDNTYLVTVNSTDINSELSPRYWLVNNVSTSDTVRIDFNEEFRSLSTHVIDLRQVYDADRLLVATSFKLGNDVAAFYSHAHAENKIHVYYPEEYTFLSSSINMFYFDSPYTYSYMNRNFNEIPNNFNKISFTGDYLGQSENHYRFDLKGDYEFDEMFFRYNSNDNQTSGFWVVYGKSGTENYILPDITDHFSNYNTSKFAPIQITAYDYDGIYNRTVDYFNQMISPSRYHSIVNSKRIQLN